MIKLFIKKKKDQTLHRILPTLLGYLLTICISNEKYLKLILNVVCHKVLVSVNTLFYVYIGYRYTYQTILKLYRITQISIYKNEFTGFFIFPFSNIFFMKIVMMLFRKWKTHSLSSYFIMIHISLDKEENFIIIMLLHFVYWYYIYNVFIFYILKAYELIIKRRVSINLYVYYFLEEF